MEDIKNISDWLKNYLTNNGLKCFVVGVSGGVDSALVSTLCCLTGLKTIVLSLPIHQNEQQLRRARLHIKWLENKFDNIEFYEFDLTQIFDDFKSLFNEEHKLALANSRSRLRMTTLYQISTMFNGLVVGTGNKIEDFGVGFFTKYGDGGVDISPIADLMKTEVRQMAKQLNILQEIIDANPTDGLWDDDRTDESQLGATYEELEWVMNNELIDGVLSPRQKEVVKIYNYYNKKNRHKMVTIPVFRKLKN